jgi:hypothetical protein
VTSVVILGYVLVCVEEAGIFEIFLDEIELIVLGIVWFEERFVESHNVKLVLVIEIVHVI